MQQTSRPSRRLWRRRALSLLLALTMTLGLVPGFPGAGGEAAAHWADPYLSQMVEWGFIREDQANNPDLALTRADFMAIVNRAYGYHETGETPFEDVVENDWYYDDVGIAYTARYIHGTSPTTASPKEALTRETAATILGRNMMLEESSGELLDFTDARQISNWATGTIKSALEHYLVSGYDDGTFRPQRNVSWGEMASMLTTLIGTPLQEPGEYALGGVYGNVTITSPNVTLRDTVISGDLYITGGVGLGGIELENVTVLGRIIASGTGQAEIGESSILLRNVIADELLVDNLQDHYVSVRADGVTEIAKTTVRTSAYIEDNTPDGMGLKYISLEGDSYPEGEEPEDWVPIQLDLAGRIEEVVNRTPRSQVRAAAGTVAKLTVDEAAEGSNVIIDRGTVVKELNLDTATLVTGEGDIEHLVVNAPGCDVEMLPDEIDIRPGITAVIDGEEMDSVAAKESSEQPMILAGYPQAQDIVPTGLDAAFMTNKSGTVYWAVTAITDGSVGEDDLIKPPSYGSLAVAHGSTKIEKGNEETIAKVTGLTPGGSYYLSAILVDARGQRSTVKVIAFTTPDNTVPAFCTGYPKMSKVSRTDSVVVVMPNKDCKLYYALLPEGASAPTEDELKTNAVSGALGYGVRDVTKNVEDAFRVNDVILDEVTNYVLYLWLTDADGVNKGKIVSLKFTTDDETPPEFIAGPTQVKTQATSVGLEFQLSEDGTVYWVAVPAGTVYPKPEPGTSYETAPLNSAYAILQVVSGMNLGADGKSGKVAAKYGVTGTINITGLKAETVYDLYYVAKDNAGTDRNYSVTVKKMTINTLDEKAPVFTQSFSNSSDGQNPRVNTDIYIDVSEDVLYLGQNGGVSLLELYAQTQTGTAASRLQAVDRLAANLRNSIVLHKYDVQTNREEDIYLKYQSIDSQSDWTVDYTQVKVESRREGGIRITFPASGLQLENGGQYCFIINDLADTSNARNPVEPDTGVDFWNYPKESAVPGHDVKPFVVDLPVINLDVPILGSEGPYVRNEDGTISTTELVRMDMSFYMEPISTSTMADSIAYDVLLWSRTTMQYDLYYRVVDMSGKVIDYSSNSDILLANTTSLDKDGHGWMYLGNSSLCNPTVLANGENGWSGRSVSSWFNNCDSSQFAQLNKLSEDCHYQFVICLTRFGDNENYKTWDDTARMEVNVAAGQAQNLEHLATSLTHDEWLSYTNLGIIRGAQSIGSWRDDTNQLSDTQILNRKFTVSTLPSFINNAPEFDFNTDGSVSISLSLSSSGTVHYAISEVDPRTGRPAITTIRELMPDTDDYQKDSNDVYTDVPDVNVQLVGNGSNPPQMYITTTGPRPPQEGGTSTEYPIPDWMIGGDGPIDDPEGKNKVTDPTELRVVSKDWKNEVVDYGAFTPQEGVTTPLTSDKVKPNTTYFAYFVITSVDNYDNMSHVYIYQFTTPEAMKPSVILDAAGGDGDVTMSIDVATRSAYRVISRSDAMNSEKVSILSQPFALYTGYAGNITLTGGSGFTVADSGFTEGTPVNYLTKTDGSPFTVLDALTTPYRYSTASPSPASDGNLKNDPSYPAYYYPDWGGDASAYAQGYTVFDMYASDTAREHLYTFIQAGSGMPPETVNIDNWGPTGSLNTSAPPASADYMDTLLEIGEKLNDSQYLILTYSINPKMVQSTSSANSSQNTSLIASFSGLIFQKGQMLPPEVDDTDGTILRDGDGGTYKGTFYIHFDRDVFLKGTTDEVTITEGNLLTGVRPNYKPSSSFGSGTVSIADILGTTAFEISFSGVKVGDTYRFPNGYFANGNNEEANKPLVISVVSKSGTIYLTITWGSGSSAATWEYPLLEDTNEYAVYVNGSGISDPRTPALELEVGGDKAVEVTASVIPSLSTLYEYTWDIPNGSDPDVISLSDNTGEKITITGLIPGRTSVVVRAAGRGTDGTLQNPEVTMPITVKGAIDPIASMTSNTYAEYDADDGLTLYTKDADGKNQTPSATFKITANGKALSSSASISCTTSGSIRYTIQDDDTITITGTAGASGSGSVSIKLVSDGVDLTDPVTIQVNLKQEAAPPATPGTDTASTMTLRTVPSLTLSGSKLKTSGSSKYTLELTASSLTEVVTATAKNVTGTVTWSVTSGKDTVVKLTGSGSKVTITGLAAGTATIKATVGSLTKTITVNVVPKITLSEPTVSADITKNADGTYNWSRKSSGNRTVKLTFTSDIPLLNNQNSLSVISTDPDSLALYNSITLNSGGKSGSFQLDFIAAKTTPTTITFTAGGVSKKLIFNLAITGNDSNINIAGKLTS